MVCQTLYFTMMNNTDNINIFSGAQNIDIVSETPVVAGAPKNLRHLR